MYQINLQIYQFTFRVNNEVVEAVLAFGLACKSDFMLYLHSLVIGEEML